MFSDNDGIKLGISNIRKKVRQPQIKYHYTKIQGKGQMNVEKNIETCILSYVKQIASPGLMHETGCSGPVHWDDPEGWDGEGGGRGFRMGNTCTPMADSCQYMEKTTTVL